ncbi:hypothetical protein BEL04_17140 [Mucilaginibacter sp. PPCGB 2223]|nr:hypothetical protein BEL04_17140 [Mucilaginibacter sp. PPCGB 2223]
MSFKAITYNADGSIWNTRTELIKDTAAIYDLYFVSKNFYTLPLPPAFQSGVYKSQKIENLSSGTNQSQRTQNLAYDEFGRVSSFGATGCALCTDKGYQFDVHYTVNNQADIMTGAPESVSAGKKYEIHYYPNGDVRWIDYLVNGKLSVQISLL